MSDVSIESVRLVIRQMMEAAGVDDPTQLAKRAGLAHTTLTRVMDPDSGNKLTWMISAKTWMKLSEASGVPVTFLGDKIAVPRQEPRGGYVVKQPIPLRILQFWDLLGPEEKDFLVTFVDVWAERIVARRKAE